MSPPGAIGRPRVAYQGVPGAFSHEAARHHLPDADLVGHPTFAEAFDAVARGDCERGFIPLVNSIAGPVPEVAELLPRSGVSVEAEHPWPIRLHLMANPQTSLERVRRVASHPMALKQCVRFLAAHGLQAEPAFDTAGAAAALAACPEPDRAVVAARSAAELYGLVVLVPDIQDTGDNITRFVLIRRRAPP